MIVQRAHNIKNQRHRQIKLEVNWQYVEEANPAFRRLMSLLLQKGKERKREVNND